MVEKKRKDEKRKVKMYKNNKYKSKKKCINYRVDDISHQETFILIIL